MPQFFKRIFSDPFRREPDMRDHLQRTRRVLVRNSTGALDEFLIKRSSLFDPSMHAEENVALRDGASLAGSETTHDVGQPILAQDPEQSTPAEKRARVRRRLSKRHRRPA
ncbi:hypothetical protein IQ07DRAFT_585726 [Pyrenochaeta sp. DS3sAY3a]|nr:hypothetical protein IQ07DRAFT_585726 [Pyrenochaeta sp. DS3sAY3a]